MKFKVGDKVKVHLVRQSIPQKRHYEGKSVTINRVLNCTHEWKYMIEGCEYVWCELEFEPVNPEKIVITHDGKTTTTTLYRDGEKVNATAKCAPDDNFDFMVGAKLAMERLVDKTTKPEPPKYYSGKVVCVANDCRGRVDKDFTPGKVYEVVNGKLRDNHGTIRPSEVTNQIIRTIDDLTNDFFSRWYYKFIPYVE